MKLLTMLFFIQSSNKHRNGLLLYTRYFAILEYISFQLQLPFVGWFHGLIKNHTFFNFESQFNIFINFEFGVGSFSFVKSPWNFSFRIAFEPQYNSLRQNIKPTINPQTRPWQRKNSYKAKNQTLAMNPIKIKHMFHENEVTHKIWECRREIMTRWLIEKQLDVRMYNSFTRG